MSDQTFDVIVVGLGGMGSSAAYHLARRGARVLGLDRFAPPHTLGSSHGKSRIIREAYFEHPDYVPLLQRAYALWHELEEASGALLTRTGGLMLGPQDSEVVSGSLRSAQVHHLRHELLTAAEVRRRYPALTPTDGVVGLLEYRAGVLRPEACVSALLTGAKEAGAKLHTDEPVLRWRAAPGGIEVFTAKDTYRAAHLILAGGAWMPGLVEELELPLQVVRRVMVWLDGQEVWRELGNASLPVFIWETEAGESFYGLPPMGGEGIKVALHSGGEPTRPDTLDREVHPEDIAALRAKLSGRIPALSEARVLDAQVCMYTNTPDSHFVLGLHPEHAQVAVAAGFSGHGFKFVSVIGDILADLALTGSSRQPIALFDPKRFTDKALA